MLISTKSRSRTDMSQFTMPFKGGQSPGLNTEPTFSAGDKATPTTQSSPDQVQSDRLLQGGLIPGSKVPNSGPLPGLAYPRGTLVQSRMIPGCKVPNEKFPPKFAATNGTYPSTDFQSSNFPVQLNQDHWTAPVSVCHACGSAIK